MKSSFDHSPLLQNFNSNCFACLRCHFPSCRRKIILLRKQGSCEPSACLAIQPQVTLGVMGQFPLHLRDTPMSQSHPTPLGNAAARGLSETRLRLRHSELLWPPEVLGSNGLFKWISELTGQSVASAHTGYPCSPGTRPLQFPPSTEHGHAAVRASSKRENKYR